VRNNLLILRLHAGADRYRATCAVLASRFREALRTIRRGERGGWKLLAMTGKAFFDDLRGKYGRLNWDEHTKS
jgi:hypothetical protein